MAHDVYPRVVYTSKQFKNNGNEARNKVIEIIAELNTKMPRSTRNDAQRQATRLGVGKIRIFNLQRTYNMRAQDRCTYDTY